MRLLIIAALTYLLLVVCKRKGVPSMRAGVLSGFIAAIAVNALFFSLFPFQPFDIISGMFSVCSAPLWGFFISNKVYGIETQK